MKTSSILAHFLVTVVTLLNTHLWSVKRTIGFTLQFVLRLTHYFGNVSGQPWQKRKSPLGQGSLQSISLLHFKALAAGVE